MTIEALVGGVEGASAAKPMFLSVSQTGLGSTVLSPLMHCTFNIPSGAGQLDHTAPPPNLSGKNETQDTVLVIKVLIEGLEERMGQRMDRLAQAVQNLGKRIEGIETKLMGNV